ncbi:UPF0182 family protein [Haloimpatiens sp. FM7315]|uniref:UPF0182 family protein n=1 Tax=Haloimpatiens sp. FM7315 TaxID=3298609 RepID=UPI0039773606
MKHTKLLFILFFVVLMFIFLDNIVNFIIDVKWFKEINYLSVYFTKMLAILKLLIPIFLIIFISIYIYYKTIVKSIKKQNEVNVNINYKKYNKYFYLVDFLISFIAAFKLANNYWYIILQYTNSSKFGVMDPIFNRDISFFVFKLPLIESFYNLLMTLFVALVVFTFIIYFVLNIKDKLFMGGKVKNIISFKSIVTKFAGKQLAVVSSIMLLLLSLGYIIKGWNLVYSPRGTVFGASYTDVKISLSFYKIISIVSLIVSIIVALSIITSKVKPIIISISVIVLLIVSEKVSAVFIQNFLVKSNEKTLEQKYINYNIMYTKKGFNIENVEEKDFKVKNDLKLQDIKENKETIDNTKVNSVNQVLEYYNQLQVLKYYYSFGDIDVDRYKINDKSSQVLISAREIDVDSLKDKASTWQNRHLTYTHGYGIVMNKVNTVTSSGKPEFLIKDIPVKSELKEEIKNPRIYFGEKTNEYAIVNTKIGELDYPAQGKNNNIKYSGKAGIPMSFMNRLLFSMSNKNIKFLLSKDITSDSKIIINRNINERLKKIAPFLIYDKDPYVVINNGKLYWIVDAYTASNRYPFSQPYNGVNYIRNSVKVVIDAFDGDTNFYVVDNNDAVIKTFSKIFPGLFKDVSKVPKGIKEHFKYPEDLFNLQCRVLGKYHVTDPMVFYSGDDLWDISRNEKQVGSEEKEEKNPTSYVILKLPGETKEEMVAIQYFNMSKKNNMVSMLCARMDEDNYGKLNLYDFNNESVDSPYLFKQNIKQDPYISKEISLWNQEGSGSGVVFGDTQILPIKNSLIYVEPLYIRASGKDSIPQMKRVIVSYGDKMIIASNMDEAINQLFIDKDIKKVEKPSEILNKNEDKLVKARDIYEKAIESQKNGDWSKYGEYIKELGEILNDLSK